MVAPYSGATMGYFPVDGESVNYLRATGRTDEQCSAFEAYFRAQKMFGMPRKGEIDYSVDLELHLGEVQPSVAGPKRPQDRINLPDLGQTFRTLFSQAVKDGGYGKDENELPKRFPLDLNGHARPTNGELEAASVAGPTDSKEGMAAEG